MNIKIKKLSDKAVLPEYATEGSVGLDIVATSERIDLENGYLSYGTSIAVQIPPGFEGQIRPRSSIRNKDLMLINSPGTIDGDFTGEVMVTFKPTRPMKARKYNVGDRIAQLVICPVVKATWTEVEELDATARGDGGHGSSSK